jgi:hypothetical protein
VLAGKEIEFIRYEKKELEERLAYKLTIRLGGMLIFEIDIIGPERG